MKLEPKMDRYCNDLSFATRSARHSGVDGLGVLNGLVGTIALSIKSSGGNDGDVADAESVRTNASSVAAVISDCMTSDGAGD